VISNFMPLGNDAAEQAGMLFHVSAANEERSGHLVLAQNRKDLFRKLLRRPVIEGQTDAIALLWTPYQNGAEECG
jgi:hypothetical protein